MVVYWYRLAAIGLIYCRYIGNELKSSSFGFWASYGRGLALPAVFYERISVLVTWRVYYGGI